MTRLLLPLPAIAGSVMTMAGPVPIEQIQPGALVWCAPEDGGGTGCFRPVLETYQNRAPEVWAISYDHDSDPATPAAILTASAGHPFWIEESRSFVPAAGGRSVCLIPATYARARASARPNEVQINFPPTGEHA